jgi:hypothetical protein
LNRAATSWVVIPVLFAVIFLFFSEMFFTRHKAIVLNRNRWGVK